MKIAFCVSEAVPFAKTGGLADVAGALPQALKKTGAQTIVLMPAYEFLFSQDYKFSKVAENVTVHMNDYYYEEFDLYKAHINNTDFYFVRNPKFFDRQNLYGTPQGDYYDNDIRFAFFSRAIFEALKKIDFIPDIIHLHDYHFGLAALLLRDLKSKPAGSSAAKTKYAIFKNTKCVFTIHNIAYQGIYDPAILERAGISYDHYNMEGVEFYGRINYMKAGIVYSDAITTVSPTYSKEILTPQYGYGLDGILNKRKKDLFGIINGIDYSIWNPETDKNIAINYSENDLQGKMECKFALIEKMFGPGSTAGEIPEGRGNAASQQFNYLEKPGISKIPVAGMVSRLSEQKGIDLIVQAMESIMENDIYFIILGTGDEKYHNFLKALSKKYCSRLSLVIGYSEKMARQIYAGSDILLMPSNYEPCGLGQLISLKYGTIPVVRDTGGLSDTIIDIKTQQDIKKKGQGFKFTNYCPQEFYRALKRALEFYSNRTLWHKIMANAMRQDFSWDYSAAEYIKLYSSLMKE